MNTTNRASPTGWNARLTSNLTHQGVLSWYKENSEEYPCEACEHAGIEIVYCDTGDGTFHINGRDYSIKSGTFLMFPGQLCHQVEVEKDYKGFNFLVAPNFLSRMTQLSQSITYDRFHLNVQRKMRSILENMESEIAAQNTKSERYVYLLMEQLTIWIERGRTNMGSQSHVELPHTTTPRILDELIEYIEANLHNDLSIKTLSNAINYSPSQIWRLTRAKIGKSPTELITGIRIARARNLLSNSDDTITNISNSIGFSSPGYFSRVFREETGMTPREYRRHYGTI